VGVVIVMLKVSEHVRPMLSRTLDVY